MRKVSFRVSCVEHTKPTSLLFRCFYATTYPVKIVVFEDLNSRGYVLGDRESGLDQIHCDLVLAKLARFHAASMVLAERDPAVMKNMSFGMIKPKAKETALLSTVFEGGLLTVIDVVKTWPDSEGLLQSLEKTSVSTYLHFDGIA